MKKNISKEYYYSFIEVTQERLKLLINKLEQYFPLIQIKTKLVNNHLVEFNSLNELFDYENGYDQRIKAITIYMRKDDYEDMLRLSIDDAGFYDYEIDLNKNVELENKIVRELENFRNSATTINKYAYFIIHSIIYIVLIHMSLLCANKLDVLNIISSKYFIVLLVVLLVIVINLIAFRIEKYFIPNAVFLWGDEISRIKRMKNLRNLIIIPIIIACILSIIKMQ